VPVIGSLILKFGIDKTSGFSGYLYNLTGENQENYSVMGQEY
jgi:hypothetical protein